MSYFIINGGRKLEGSIQVSSSKNSVIAILCAAIMIRGKTVLRNVPRIEEVKRIVEILESIGVKVRWNDESELEVQNDGNLNLDNLNKESFLKTRAGFLLLGALSGVLDEFSLPKTGGCNLGKRTVSPHLMGFKYLGIEIEERVGEYRIRSGNRRGAEFVMYESGDTATENVLMAAVLAKGKSRIHFASSNYMVQDLCYFLRSAGAKIKGFGTFDIEVDGVGELGEVDGYSIMPDPIEAMTLISMAITTKSNLTIKGCPIDFLRLELEKLKVMGQEMKIGEIYKTENGHFDLVDIEIIPSKLRALSDKIYGRPYPGLNIDNLPLFLPIATQAKGQTLIHDWTYENRAVYYIELNRLGAEVMLHDPHRVTVTGPTELKPAEIICPPALRPSINLLICMLAAKGKSILRNAYPIDRGYERIVERLNEIGADIKRVEG